MFLLSLALVITVSGCGSPYGRIEENGKSPEDVANKNTGSLSKVTEEDRLKILEKGRVAYTGKMLTKEEVNKYIDEALKAIDNNRPLYEKRITEMEANREEIINSLAFEKLSRYSEGMITFADASIKEIYNQNPGDTSLSGLKFTNERLATALTNSFPNFEDVSEERREQIYEQKRQYVRDGHSTMEEEFENSINMTKRAIEEENAYKEYMILAREQFGQESISLEPEQKKLVEEVLEANEKNVNILEGIIEKAKKEQTERRANSLLKELSIDMDKMDNMKETEARKIYEVQYNPDNMSGPDYRGIKDKSTILEDTLSASLSIAKWSEEEINRKLKDYDGPHPFYGLIEEPDHYYKDKDSLLHDYTVTMIDYKLCIEEYNKVLKNALDGKIYHTNNEFFHYRWE